MHVTLLNKVPIENITLAHGIDPVSAIDISAAISAAEMLQPTQTREQRPIFRQPYRRLPPESAGEYKSFSLRCIQRQMPPIDPITTTCATSRC